MSDAFTQGELALVWRRSLYHPFRLRANDIVPIDGTLCRVTRVTKSAAVVLTNQQVREFSTRFDKRVRFQPAPVTFCLSANSEIEILNHKHRDHRRGKPQ